MRNNHNKPPTKPIIPPIPEVKPPKVEQAFDKNIDIQLKDYCTGCAEIWPIADLHVSYVEPGCKVFEWSVYVHCKHSEKCAHLCKRFKGTSYE